MSNVVDLQQFTYDRLERRMQALLSRMTPEQIDKVVKAIERAEAKIRRELADVGRAP